MKLFGIKSIFVFIIIQIIIIALLVGFLGIYFFIVEIVLFVLLFIRIIGIDKDNVIKIFSPLEILKVKNKIHIYEINRVIIKDGGLPMALTSIYLHKRNNTKVKFIFLLMYPFERKQLAMYLRNKGVVVDGNGILKPSVIS